MKQTAVEWLFNQLWDTPKDKITWYALLEQAKSMEKEKLQWISGFLTCAMKDNNLPYGIEYLNLLADKQTDAEQYYNETYNIVFEK